MEEKLIDIIVKEKIDEMAKSIESIDQDVMRIFLVEDGWTEVEFYYKNNEHAIDVLEWCGKNIKENQWSRLNSYFVFCKKEDAEWFILRWK